MANLEGKRIDSTYVYVLNSDPNTAIVTNGDGSAVNWHKNLIVLQTGNQTISGVKNFESIPKYQGLDIVYKNNPLSGLGEGVLHQAQNSNGSIILAGNINNLSGNYSVILAGEGHGLTGDRSAILVGVNNLLTGDRSLIGAGSGNYVSGDNSSIAGGKENSVQGSDSFIAAGFDNKIFSNKSIIGAGDENRCHSLAGGILAGLNNTVSGQRSVIGGGFQNEAVGDISAILGGRDNQVQEHTYSSNVLGGRSNKVTSGDYSSIAGGHQNIVSGSFSAIVGGILNSVENSDNSIIGVGTGNLIKDSTGAALFGGNSNMVSGNRSVLIGGGGNKVFGDEIVLMGGKTNTASGEFATLFAGENNNVTGIASTIVAGRENNIQNSNDSSIIAGSGQLIAGALRSSIHGGRDNTNTNSHDSSITAGTGNTLTSNTNSLIGAGRSNTLQSSHDSTINAGTGNTIASSQKSFIAAGHTNDILNSLHSSINAGHTNKITGSNYSFVSAAISGQILQSTGSAIIAGLDNKITGSIDSFIGGGNRNLISKSDNSLVGTSDDSVIDINTDVIFTFTGFSNETLGHKKIVERGFASDFTKFPFADISSASSFSNFSDDDYTYSDQAGFERVSGLWLQEKRFDEPVYASILNGKENKIESDFSTILNGSGNELAGANSVIFGINNKASGHNSYILGGTGNKINLGFLPTGLVENFSFGFGLTRNYENYNTIIAGENNEIGANEIGEVFATFAGGFFEGVQNRHVHIFGGEKNSANGISNFILNGKRNTIHATTFSPRAEFNISEFTAGDQEITQFHIPELSGVFATDFIRHQSTKRQTYEGHSFISSSVGCTTHGTFLSINNSINSDIESGQKFNNNSVSSTQDAYPFFCNVNGSLGSLIKGSHYASIFNGIGNEILEADNSFRISNINSTILNGNRNKIVGNGPEFDAVDSTINNTYCTILNGLRNELYNKKSTIINGLDNISSGRSTLIFGDDNIISASEFVDSPAVSFIFGKANTMSGAAFTTQQTRQDGNYIFGRKNELKNCSSVFAIGGHKFTDAGNTILVDNKFILCRDVFSFNNEVSEIADCNDSNMGNIVSSYISGVSNSSLQNIRNVTTSQIFDGRLNVVDRSTIQANICDFCNVSDTTISGVNTSALFNVTHSDITGMSHSRVQGSYNKIGNLSNNNCVDDTQIFGNHINITGRVGLDGSNIHGDNIDFKVKNEGNFCDYSNIDILGSNHSMFGNQGDMFQITIRGGSNNITTSSRLFLHGSQIDVEDSNDSFFFGKNIDSTGDSTFIFGEKIKSEFKGGSVIRDSNPEGSFLESKGQDTLLLSFAKGTYLNMPSGNSSNTTPNDGVPGSLLYSGEFLLVKTGLGSATNSNPHGWGKIQISSLD
tara:strand:- start:2406 stop:6545 length:4140 start_codon:yes stop_codon:yes gene_type:complete